MEDNITIFLARLLDKEECIKKVNLEIEGYSDILDSSNKGKIVAGKSSLMNYSAKTDVKK